MADAARSLEQKSQKEPERGPEGQEELESRHKVSLVY